MPAPPDGGGGTGDGGWIEPGGSTGGGSSGGTDIVDVNIPIPDIIDSLGKKYPCTRVLIAALPNLNIGIAKLIYQAFGAKNGNDIVFLVGDQAYFAANQKSKTFN